MMPVEIPVFIDLENRMTRVLTRAINQDLDPLRRKLRDAAREGDLRTTARLTEQINLGPAAESVRGDLQIIGLNAVLLGAAQFVDGFDARKTMFVRDAIVPQEVANAAEQTIRFLDGNGTERIRAVTQDLVNQAEHLEPEVAKAELRGSGALAGALNQAVAGGTKVQAGIGANLTTSRLVSLGALAQAQRLSIDTYQWNAVLDSRTCPFCNGMHGKTFDVRPNLNRVQQILGSQDPDVARALSPWPDTSKAGINRLAGMTNGKLQDEGFSLPPAHPRCRCVVSMIGSVPISQITGFKRRPVGRKPPIKTQPSTGPVPISQPLRSQRLAESTEDMWRKSDGAWLPGRVNEVHDPAIADLFRGKRRVPSNQTPEFHMMGGGSGAGKGTVIRKGMVKVKKRTVSIDADEMKKTLPEYQQMTKAGDTKAAAFAHRESSYLTDRAMRQGFAERYDVLLDGTGDGSLAKLTGRIQPARDAGYNVVADYVTIPTDVAVNRAMERAIMSGRVVPEAQIRMIHRDVSRTLKEAVDRKIFDKVRLWDNSGANPILVMEQRGGVTKILRPDLWDDFLRKADEDIARRLITDADLKLVELARTARDAGKPVEKFLETYRKNKAKVAAQDLVFKVKGGKRVEVAVGSSKDTIAAREEVAAAWEKILPGQKPKQLIDDLFRGTDTELNELRVVAASSGRSISISGKLTGPRVAGKGESTLEFARRFSLKDGKVVVGHDLLTATSAMRGTGIVPRFFRNSMDFYRSIGVETIEIDAALSAGGYAWARYGFVPKPWDWKNLQGVVGRRIDALAKDVAISEAKARTIRDILESKDPKAIWKIADLREVPKGDYRPLGRVLLQGTAWAGSFNLFDALAMNRLRRYLLKALR
jgi:predicted ABC-type ATPase